MTTMFAPLSPLCAKNGWKTDQIGRIEVKVSVQFRDKHLTETIDEIGPSTTVEEFRRRFGDGDFTLLVYAPDGSLIDQVIHRNANTENPNPEWRAKLVQKYANQQLDHGTALPGGPGGPGGPPLDPYGRAAPGHHGGHLGPGFSFGGPEHLPGGLSISDDMPHSVAVDRNHVPIARGLSPEAQQEKIDEYRREMRKDDQRSQERSLADQLVSALVIPMLQTRMQPPAQTGYDQQAHHQISRLESENDRLHTELSRIRGENGQLWNDNTALQRQVSQQPVMLAQKDAEIARLTAELERTRAGLSNPTGQPTGMVEKALGAVQAAAPMINVLAGAAQNFLARGMAPQQAHVEQGSLPVSGSFPSVPGTPVMGGGYGGPNGTNGMG